MGTMSARRIKVPTLCRTCGKEIRPGTGGARGLCPRCYKRLQRGLEQKAASQRAPLAEGQPFTVRLPLELLHLVLLCADEARVSRSEIVRRAVVAWIKTYGPAHVRDRDCLKEE